MGRLYNHPNRSAARHIKSGQSNRNFYPRDPGQFLSHVSRGDAGDRHSIGPRYWRDEAGRDESQDDGLTQPRRCTNHDGRYRPRNSAKIRRDAARAQYAYSIIPDGWSHAVFHVVYGQWVYDGRIGIEFRIICDKLCRTWRHLTL